MRGKDMDLLKKNPKKRFKQIFNKSLKKAKNNKSPYKQNREEFLAGLLIFSPANV